ncbi:MAG: tRNA (N(6)-L-threonylcarbamoyladenosine(37)-C(2))-methylthiotransferase MtaB [Bacteroidales bacterium]|jgi:threonylcarbamoyladenosine tRNA methylthiotransferase MtaB|nr:tRNA (N(6)-L-threonylcarbamoyladenosine(37)-C(2))-methylthiotransferase MtaB [Bacteroidales bacterium]
MNNPPRKKIAFHTLGCKLNFTETSTISRSFPEDQFERVPASSQADIYVINTCSVTDTADRKCKQAIRKFINQSPGAFIAVVGCYAQLRPQEIALIPGVDLVLGTNEKFDAARYISELGKKKKAEVHSCEVSASGPFIPSWSAGDRTRSFLKVQDGCDYGCSYCTIPLARGQSRNPDIGTLVAEAETIASAGIKEIVITGVNVGDFGKSTGDTFTGLMRELVRVRGIERFRISSIEPNLLTDELIAFCADNSKVLPHFHIPLQSGCNRMLALMGRRYRRELFSGRVEQVKRRIPLAGLGADVITGFPGETDQDAEETYTFLESLPLSYLHVFTFSERPGTRASGMTGRVTRETKDIRSRMLTGLSRKKHKEFLLLNKNRTAGVLFERTRSEGMITGYTENYIRVEYPWNSALAGTIRKVKLKELSGENRMSIDIID